MEVKHGLLFLPILLLVALIVVVSIGLFVWSLVWVYRDGTKRGTPGHWLAAALLIAFFTWPFGLVFWLIIRDRPWKKETAVSPPVIHPPVPRTCSQCGTSLAEGAPQGLCPVCLLGQGVASETAPRNEHDHFVPPAPLELAQHFPQLEILELLGQGGMGAVYKARQSKLDRFVALKILPPNAGKDPGFAERFSREARALARLTHPGIVAVHDFGQSDGIFWVMMEYVDGLNLRQLLRSQKMEAKEALAIVPQICDALQFAHDEGIVHRDIKPENILLDKKGRVKIADFGLAKILGKQPADFTITGAHDKMGTPHYMAPEQVEKPQTVDHRADIYSLGVVFYEMLTGELPLGRFPAPSRVRGIVIDVRLDEVVLRALEKEPELRYQHASDVKTMVETIVTTPEGQGSEVRSQKPAGSLSAPRPATDATFASWLRHMIVVGRRGGRAVIHWPGVLFSSAIIIAAAETGAVLASLALMHRIDERAVLIAFCFALMVIGIRVRRGKTMSVEKLMSLDAPPPTGTGGARGSLPLFVERAGQRQLYWPGVLQLCSTVGLTVGCVVLATARLLQMLHTPFQLTVQPGEPLFFLLLLVACVAMRFAASRLAHADAERTRTAEVAAFSASNAPAQFSPAANVIRWIARGLGLLGFAFVMMFISAEGFPPFWKQPPGVQAELGGMVLMLVGLLVGWKREGWGTTLIVAGWLVFFIVENGRPPVPFTAFLVVAALYAYGWWQKHRVADKGNQKIVNDAEWNNPANWTGPKWLSLYFSKRDSRVWVRKQIPALGWTVNLGNRKGAAWLFGIIVAIFVFATVLPGWRSQPGVKPAVAPQTPNVRLSNDELAARTREWVDDLQAGRIAEARARFHWSQQAVWSEDKLRDWWGTLTRVTGQSLNLGTPITEQGPLTTRRVTVLCSGEKGRFGLRVSFFPAGEIEGITLLPQGTDVPVQPKTVPALPEKPASAENLSFGPVIERVLRYPRTGQNHDVVRLRDGAMTSLPSNFYDGAPKFNEQWLLEDGAKFFPAMVGLRWGLVATRAKFVSVPDRLWDNPTVAQLSAALERDDASLLQYKIQGGAAWLLPEKASLPQTLAFLMQDGTWGVVQITDIVGLDRAKPDEPHSVTIRYKLAPVPGQTVLTAADGGSTNRTPRLQFRLVAEEHDSAWWQLMGLPERNGPRTVPVCTEILLDETAVASASLTNSLQGLAVIDLQFTEMGAARFRDITAGNVRRQLAIVFDGKLLAAPTIMQPITGGKANITGNLTTPAALAIVQSLNPRQEISARPEIEPK